MLSHGSSSDSATRSNYGPKRLSYADFILKDRCCHLRQMHSLVYLRMLHTFYAENGLLDSASPSQNTFFLPGNIHATFELYRIKRAVLHNEPITFSERTQLVLTEYASQVFILAMIHGNVPVIRYFLERKIINPNASMFPSPSWPSYFLFSCSCSHEVFSAFRQYSSWTNYEVSWFGLSPALLCTATKKTPDERGDISFMSYQQFYHHNMIRGVTLLPSSDNLPIFPLDFACIMKDVAEIRRILEETPEAGMLSRVSFLVQCEEHIILVLSRYGFSTEQNFNKNTPLHYSCSRGDFCTLSMLLYLGFPITANKQGLYPNEIGEERTREKASIFFNLCASTPVKASGGSNNYIRVFNPQTFTKNMTRWMHVLNFKESEFDKYIGIFKYLDFNREHRIFKKSRFSIINVFGFSKTPLSVEKMVQRFLLLVHPPFFPTSKELRSLYDSYFGANTKR